MTTQPVFIIKIDVDTDQGTKIGVPNLTALLSDLNIPATFLFSIGPDNTGRAIKRIFRPGFLKKVLKTNVASNYGLRTLLYGTLLPGPNIGKRHAHIMRNTHELGFEVGIHCYDHIKWQDGVTKMEKEKIIEEFNKATSDFQEIFSFPAKVAGAPGWQANEKTLIAYDKANLTHASDCRGTYPFLPKTSNTVFNVLQIPTTLPTLDEIIGDPNVPEEELTPHFLSLLNKELPNVMTIHAELEGMKYLSWFKSLIITLKKQNFQFQTLATLAKKHLQNRNEIPVCELIQGKIKNRSGLLALQKPNLRI